MRPFKGGLIKGRLRYSYSACFLSLMVPTRVFPLISAQREMKAEFGFIAKRYSSWKIFYGFIKWIYCFFKECAFFFEFKFNYYKIFKTKINFYKLNF